MHQIIQATPKGAVYFVDKVLSVEIFLSPGCRLEDEEDATVYSDGGDLDQFIPRRQWPGKELPEVPEVPQPVPSPASAAASADRPQLISDLQTVHDSAAKSLEAMGINACEVFLQNKVDTVLAKAGPGATKCSICNQELTTSQSLMAHIISKHMKAKSPFNVRNVRRPLEAPMPSRCTLESIPPAPRSTSAGFVQKSIPQWGTIMRTWLHTLGDTSSVPGAPKSSSTRRT